MNKIKIFLKKYFWVWILIIVTIAIIGDAFLQNAKTKPVFVATPVPQVASYKSIVPGVATEAYLNKILGTPLKTTISGSVKTDEYTANNTLRHHIAIVQGQKVTFIKEIVSSSDTITTKDLISIYGVAPNILYSKLPNSTFNLYVYPANGIAYLGHKDGTLLEIWYFVPTSMNNFIDLWGQDYQTSPPEPVQ